MFVKKSSLKRVGSAVQKKSQQQQNKKEKSLNKLLGLKNESIAEKYFQMTQKQKGQKECVLENYNELDEMIHNYLSTNTNNINNKQSNNLFQTPIQQSILFPRTTNALNFQNDENFNRTTSKNLLLAQTYTQSYDHPTTATTITKSGGPLSHVMSENILKKWSTTSDNCLESKSNQIFEANSEGESNSQLSNAQNMQESKVKQRNKEIYNNLTNLEYNFTNIQTASTSHTKEDFRLQKKREQTYQQGSNVGSSGQTVNQANNNNNNNNNNNYTHSKQSNTMHSNQENSSNILDNNSTNNTITIRSSKLNSTLSNNTGPSTPNYAMGTIVSNNKTNQARCFSRTRPVTAAISKTTFLSEKHQIHQDSISSNKPWLRHELFTRKQKDELIDEYDENSRSNSKNKKIGYGRESGDSGNDDHSKSRISSTNEKKNRDSEEEEEEDEDNIDFKDCSENVKCQMKGRGKVDQMRNTTDGGFQGYKKLRSEQNKSDKSTCDNIIRDCENIINKIQKRDGQQLYNSQRKENSIFGSTSQQKKQIDSQKLIGEGGRSSVRSSFRVSSTIPRPQSVRKISQNNLIGSIGELGYEECLQAAQEDDHNALQRIANTLLKKKLNDIDDDDQDTLLFSTKSTNKKTNNSIPNSTAKLSTPSYPHRQYSKDNYTHDEKNDKLKHYEDTNQLSQIQEQQEGDVPITKDQLQKSTPNIYKKSNSLPRSQSSAKQSNNNRFYDVNDKIIFTDKKEKLTQEALKAAAAIAKNVSKFSGNYSNNNQNAILQRPESKRQSTTGAIINMNSTATGTVSSTAISANLFLMNSLKRNSEIIDRSGKENIKSIVTSMKMIQNNNEKQNKNEDKEEKREVLGISNKQSRPATATINKIGEMSSQNNLTTNKLMERYDIKCSIGKGSYAVVKLAKDTHTDKNVAIKMYDKYKLIDPQKRNNVKREIAILNKLDHTNIIKLFSTIDTRSSVNLIMEYISSASLRQFMKEQDGRQLEERYARTIFKQLVSAVQYCHEWEVIHRDIKLENVMLDVTNNHQIKLIDFGFAIRIPPEKKLNIFCGTPSYMSPEITKKKEYYGKPADIWSLGVVLYALVCGRFPFKGKDDNDLFRKIQSGDYKIPGNVSQSASKLINKLLRQNPTERPTAKEVVQDRWFLE